MKMSTYNMLCCPVCKRELKLTVEEKKTVNGEDDVISGVLHCEACGADYRIDDGIPDLLPKEE